MTEDQAIRLKPGDRITFTFSSSRTQIGGLILRGPTGLIRIEWDDGWTGAYMLNDLKQMELESDS